ncbi:hypothetical protein GCK72_026176 [Caenorhabditis remanei]|uniref:Uncharacterized protein n=1 Tax=Caenorhabditis remanei TaxID=31234 RepID=A0A6A5G3Y0_CAERE|nr:hypothetical protein GCK72_026176 [Caenorhabditis remanei]KAF1749708.1 hypothetical protein GCK72_026176 [Caenorhabditis remanei]
MSLAQIAKSFNIENGKRDFPRKFTQSRFFDYEGPIPGDEYYGLDNKPAQKRKDLKVFLETERSSGRVFNSIDVL